MFRNYLKIIIRNLKKQKLYSAINIFGLSIGIACFLIMFLFIQFFISYDDFQKNRDRLHLIYRENVKDGNLENRANIGTALAPLVEEQVSGVENVTRFSFFEGILFSKEVCIEENIIFSDPSFFDMFSFPLLKGDPHTALNEPFSVVITEAIAQKYFYSEEPINQIISFKLSGHQQRYDFKVTGVLKDIPPNSHMHFEWLASYQTLYQIMNDGYLYHHWDSATLTYVELAENVTLKNIETQLTKIAKMHVDRGPYDQTHLKLLPFHQPFFKPFYMDGYLFGDSGSLKMIMIFLSVLSTAILLVACFNYINLSTAKSTTHSKEVGIRKVIGANQKQIFLRFLGESVLFSFFALLLASVWVELILPYFNQLTGLELTVDYADNIHYLLMLVGICLVSGLLAGAYPAFIIASFQPVSIFHKQTGVQSPARLRKVFVVFQFIITTIFIVITLVIHKQIRFIQTKDLGFNQNHVVVLPIQDRTMIQKYDLIKHELLKNGNIIQVAGSSQKIGTSSSPNGTLISTKSIQELDICIVYTDYDYTETMGLKLKAGRSFNPVIASDQDAILLNESAYRLLEKSVPIGGSVELGWKSQGQYHEWCQSNVIGILDDFHFRNLQYPIYPVIFQYQPYKIQYMFIRFQGSQISDVIAHLKHTLRQFAPEQPVEFSFLDEDITTDYQFFRSFEKAIGMFMILALSIACLGLFGLSAFITVQRTKEIGIRKVLGASSGSIFSGLCFDFIKWIVIANVVACPTAYIISKNFILQDFAYRIDLTIWPFLLAGLSALIIALLTVSWQVVRAATANPVESLRYE